MENQRSNRNYNIALTISYGYSSGFGCENDRIKYKRKHYLTMPIKFSGQPQPFS